MSQVYRVHVTSSAGKDRSAVLQVLADDPAEAAAAVRAKVGDDALVQADADPLSTEQAERSGVIAGRILLS